MKFARLHQLILLYCVAVPSQAFGQSTRPEKPATAATVQQAASVIDLSKFPLVDGAEEPNTRVIAGQGYTAQGNLVDVARSLQKKLSADGWKELDGAQFIDGYASAFYQKQGFLLSLSVMPGAKPGSVSVNLKNHGNVDLKKLPVPKGATELYSFPGTTAYLTDLKVSDANVELKKLLTSAGWKPFGETTASFFVRQNAVRLQVMVSEAPAQPGKTAIQFSSEQLSLDLPVPGDATLIDYKDSSTQMLVDSPSKQAKVVDFYVAELGKQNWEPTTENPIRIDFHDHLIFRNSEKEMLEIEFQEVDEKTRATITFTTAEEVERLDKRARELAAMKKKELEEEEERKRNPPKITVQAPSGAQAREKEKKSIEFSIGSGKAQAAVAAWIKTYEDDGWKLTSNVNESVAGNFDLKKDKVELHVDFVDPGFIPGEITISVRGNYQLELK